MSSSGDSQAFERERNHLIYEIAQGLDRLTNNLSQLNRNLQDANSLGQSMEQTADVWRAFNQQIAQTSNDPSDNRVE
ncbi:hypothetical protein H4R33_000618 [Dimargaris cristalligena]|uniref:DASH complex subunit DAD1 n=1 Tax=Dimargaris cristalligena TaxID=215637 RepID=A0A4Q0A081_9FUNG|nr:hypothetical protein H4R33_000618 [Dimargaris cristalligena]RKP38662.1 hypothetical protein BJ085DRAFT_36544 [Dimargaris cristalligena]|eukprot:RKP38662.1 hypothetical protein BJ085DRAFT_36544 [Dimargaris cristalligena]